MSAKTFFNFQKNKKLSKSNTQSSFAQGSIEYLLIIGVVILVVGIVAVSIINLVSSPNNIPDLNDNLTKKQLEEKLTRDALLYSTHTSAVGLPESLVGVVTSVGVGTGVEPWTFVPSGVAFNTTAVGLWKCAPNYVPTLTGGVQTGCVPSGTVIPPTTFACEPTSPCVVGANKLCSTGTPSSAGQAWVYNETDGACTWKCVSGYARVGVTDVCEIIPLEVTGISVGGTPSSVPDEETGLFLLESSALVLTIENKLSVPLVINSFEIDGVSVGPQSTDNAGFAKIINGLYKLPRVEQTALMNSTFSANETASITFVHRRGILPRLENVDIGKTYSPVIKITYTADGVQKTITINPNPSTVIVDSDLSENYIY